MPDQKKCQCDFCQRTYPAIKRMAHYLKPDDFEVVQRVMDENEMLHMQVATLPCAGLRKCQVDAEVAP